jgi:mycofactocin precursor
MALGAIILPGTPPDVIREHVMAEQTVQTDTAVPADTAVPTGTGPLVEEDLLVEEVSIDGMCGVY